MKPLNWVELSIQQIKARNGFGWSIQGIEKQNKVLTKIVYRFSTGGRTTVLTDIEWNTNNSKKIQDLIIEFETLMEERHVDLKKAYELIVGNKVFTDKKNINWEVKEGISAEEFQEFIDGPSGPGFGQDALMNICKPIDTALMNGQTPYPPVFS